MITLKMKIDLSSQLTVEMFVIGIIHTLRLLINWLSERDLLYHVRRSQAKI